MKPYNLVNTHKTVHSFSTYNKTYFKKNEFSIPLISAVITGVNYKSIWKRLDDHDFDNTIAIIKYDST